MSENLGIRANRFVAEFGAASFARGLPLRMGS
jgi:hypothetical protein